MGAKKSEVFLGISNSTSRSVCFKEIRERIIGQDTLHPLLASVAQSQVHSLAHTNVYTPHTYTTDTNTYACIHKENKKTKA